MKNFKRIIASASAAVLAATAMFAAVPASAATVEKEIAYNGPSAKAFALENDGVSLRLNIFNEWGTSVKDINNKGEFNEKVAVTFTVDGLGEDSANIAEDGTEVPYEAFLSGAIGTDGYWGEDSEDNTVENEYVAIEGDGTYTTEFLLNDPADTILCLILSTNINAYQYTETGLPADTGITFTVDKITTMAEGAGPVIETPTAYLAGTIGAKTIWSADEVTTGSKTAAINGDAQYEVIWNVDDGGTDTLQMLAVEIPGLTKTQYENLVVKVDGVYVDGAAVSGYKTSASAINTNYVEESKSATRIYLIDSWTGTGVADIAGTTAVTQSVKVVFTVSGTGKTGTSNVASDYVMGDVNRNGKVDLQDVILIAKQMLGTVKFDAQQLLIGDLNGNGKIDLQDCIKAAKILLAK